MQTIRDRKSCGIFTQLGLFLALGLFVILADTAQAGYYQQILSCDNGAAVVDRNTLSPRYPQVVIRNRQIVGYIVSQLTKSGYYGNANSEIILSGPNDRDIYRPDDFHGFLVPGVGQDWVRREGRGLRVSFNRLISGANSDCGHDIPASSPSCQPRLVEVANWYFQDCR